MIGVTVEQKISEVPVLENSKAFCRFYESNLLSHLNNDNLKTASFVILFASIVKNVVKSLGVALPSTLPFMYAIGNRMEGEPFHSTGCWGEDSSQAERARCLSRTFAPILSLESNRFSRLRPPHLNVQPDSLLFS